MTARLTALLALLAATATVVVAAPVASAAPPGSGSATVPVTGTFTDALGGTGTFAGEYTITRFARQGDQVVAIGTVSGTLTDSLGNVVGTDTQAATIPVGLPQPGAVVAQQATCEILDLTLGPLDLDLLGLVVHLDTVHLNITAEQGAGNLLGNLLCAVAGLLDPPTGGGGGGGLTGLLNSIVTLLNQILGALG